MFGWCSYLHLYVRSPCGLLLFLLRQINCNNFTQLFILANDTEKNLHSKIRQFADDSAIYREIQTENDSHILQEDLFKLQNAIQRTSETLAIAEESP